mgnify:CR=1 FL=1
MDSPSDKPKLRLNWRWADFLGKTPLMLLSSTPIPTAYSSLANPQHQKISRSLSKK